LATNIHHDVSSLTQPSILAPSTKHLDENEQICQQILEAKQNTKEANENVAMLMDRIKLMEQN